MVAEQERNRKLAKWAGFAQNYFGDEWRYPDGEVVLTPLDEVFQSLDACFKWLVPKLDGYTLNHQAEWPDVVVAKVRTVNRYFEGANSSPALALCLAIEELIDREAS